LADIWPSLEEIREVVTSSINSALYRRRYSRALEGDSSWNSLVSYVDEVYHWEENSTYIRRPPWFEGEMATTTKRDIFGARVLALLEDKVTTDHISPAGSIPFDSPAGKYLVDRGVDIAHFSAYGSRRGNHEVMVRGGFSNPRLVNLLCPGREGGWTTHLPTGRQMTIFDASVEYGRQGIPLLIIAGKQYGTGSSRDWAAKAPKLLGVRAVIAESFERIHRSNLIAMGVLPLQFMDGESARTLGLTGREEFDVLGISSMKGPNESVEVVARGEGSTRRFSVVCRIDNQVEMRYAEHGGVLPYVFSKLSKGGP
jgi:aconitate hydratase